VQALVLTSETFASAKMINDKRAQEGLSKLDVISIEVVSDSHASDKISSTEIRARLIHNKL
jgi:phosphopantetheine adenylyltransferase